MSMMCRARGFIVCSSACLVAGRVATAFLPAQAPQTQPSPVFRSGVDVIVVDVRVTTGDGTPVAGLTADQFEVRVDGQPRRVLSAEFTSFGSGSASRPATQVSPWDAVYSTNERETELTAPGRLVALLVDQGSFRPFAAQAAITGAQRMIDQLQPSDSVALITFPSPGPTVNFTRDVRTVRAAVGKIIGMADSPGSPLRNVSLMEAGHIARGDDLVTRRVKDRECPSPPYRGIDKAECDQEVEMEARSIMAGVTRQVMRSVAGLQSAIASLGSVDGPKTAVLVSAGLASDNRVDGMASSRDLTALARAATLARVSLFVLHLDHSFLDSRSADRRFITTTPMDDASTMSAGLETLAEASGGTLLRVVAAADAAFERIAREISATYLLGVESVPADRDGKPHRIDVRVRRPGARVSHREEVILPATPRFAPSRTDLLREALASPRTATALPLVLSHTTLRTDTRDRVRLILSAEIGRGLSAPGGVNVAYVLSDSAGRVVGSASGKGPLPVAGQGAGAALAYVEVLAIPPGVYSVKLAAMDTAGRIGSILHHVDAQVEKGERASLSDLVLVDPARRSSDQLTPLADGRVIGDRVDTYLEVYPDRQTRLTSVAFEISERPDSPALLSGASMPQEEDAGGRWTAGVTVDLRVLPPGVYTMSARALAGDRVIGRVSRPFRREAPARAAAGGEPRAEFAIAVSGGLLRTFNPHDALTPDALEFFLNRLQLADGGSESPAVSSAVAAVRNGKFDEAIATLSGAGSDRLSVPFVTGLALFGKGQLEPAAARFRAALRISSEFLPAVFYLGACYAAGGRDREAAGAWQISLVTESDARIIYDVLADALLRLQDGEQALSILNEARERWPDDEAFVPRLAAAQALSQRRDQAVETLVPYIERHPADIAALVLAVRLLYDAHASGTAASSPARDRELVARFAALYRAANGPQAALVDRWAAFVQQSRVGR